MIRNTDWVSPFWGNWKTEVERRPVGTMAENWQWLKALPGNTHPGACRPFGMISACAYTGGYPTGYSPYQLNCSAGPDQPGILLPSHAALGFTHFQVSGTGMIKRYYNFVLVSPVAHQQPYAYPAYRLAREVARPGYYGANFEEIGVRGEVAVSGHGAAHRFLFPRGSLPEVRLDLTFSYATDPRFGDRLRDRGLDVQPEDHRARHASDRAEVVIVDSRTLRAEISVAGAFPLFVFAQMAEAGVWTRDDGTAIEPGVRTAANAVRFQPTGDSLQVDLNLGFSLKSLKRAERHVDMEMARKSLDRLGEEARKEWDEVLGRIRVFPWSREQKEVFYSALYFSMIKPADFSGENPFRVGDGPFYLDFATLWDQVKTQLPLVLMLDPDRGAQMVNSLIDTFEDLGRSVNGLVMEPEVTDDFAGQGCALGYPIVAQAARMKLDGIPWKRALKVLLKSLPSHVPEGKTGVDFAAAAFSVAQVALAAGDETIQRRWMRLAGHWKAQYSKATGKLCKGAFYEGTDWNYSFSVWHDAAGLIELNGGPAAFVQDLDCFFGRPEARLREVHHEGFGTDLLPESHRFEGLNNESDMDAPYMYLYAGRHDRLCEVIRCALQHRFIPGRGGLPGNDDSGGLSSWYVWNAIGLFPVVGQAIYLIGSPSFPETRLEVGGRSFVIRARNVSEKNLYVIGARLNGTPLDRPWLYHHEILAGDLVVDMSDTPSDWGSKELPPSYPTHSLPYPFERRG